MWTTLWSSRARGSAALSMVRRSLSVARRWPGVSSQPGRGRSMPLPRTAQNAAACRVMCMVMVTVAAVSTTITTAATIMSIAAAAAVVTTTAMDFPSTLAAPAGTVMPTTTRRMENCVVSQTVASKNELMNTTMVVPFPVAALMILSTETTSMAMAAVTRAAVGTTTANTAIPTIYATTVSTAMAVAWRLVVIVPTATESTITATAAAATLRATMLMGTRIAAMATGMVTARAGAAATTIRTPAAAAMMTAAARVVGRRLPWTRDRFAPGRQAATPCFGFSSTAKLGPRVACRTAFDRTRRRQSVHCLHWESRP
mmetsp:Transcript_607/g.2063  ORF Transcript_607/g.2063 Transcript_607/m.2063 type:complete len:314 (-) Transcript_607:1002-1943(-)